MLRHILFAATVAFAALPASAQQTPETEALFEALGLSRIIPIMRTEGIEYGESIAEGLFPGQGGPSWTALVEDIYDEDRMTTTVQAGFARELAGADLGPMLDFFRSERGQRIIDLEVTARAALLEPDVEEAADAAAMELPSENPERHERLATFVETNDLVEANVMGALNSNYAFYMGLIDGNAFDGEMTEDQVLADVWAQEEDLRADTTEWVFSYLGLAYAPLADDDLDAYIAFSRTPEGRALNAALFAAFDDMYIAISRDLGRGAARFLVGQDI